MRHRKRAFRKLGRNRAHRKALLRNLAISLIQHKRIVTTVPRAKELRRFIEPLVTRAREDSMHNRREVFRYLQNKEAVKILFSEIAPRCAHRPGGYTRVLRISKFRRGDASELAVIEFVDFNPALLKEKGKEGAKSSVQE